MQSLVEADALAQLKPWSTIYDLDLVSFNLDAPRIAIATSGANDRFNINPASIHVHYALRSAGAR